MMGKGSRVGSGQLLSLLVVLGLLLSGLVGLVLSMGSPARGAFPQDTSITITAPMWVNNTVWRQDGNITINAGGVLTVQNGGLTMVSDNAAGGVHKHWITVNAGGQLILINSVLTTEINQVNGWPFLDVTVSGAGATLAATDSTMRYPGTLRFDTGATGTLTRTTVTGFLTVDITAYFDDGSGVIDTLDEDKSNGAPRISVLTGSTLTMVNSRLERFDEVDNIATGNSAAKLVLQDDSDLVAIDSYIGVDFYSTAAIHNVLELRNTAQAHLYGVTFEPYGGALYNRAGAVVVEATATTAASSVYRWADVLVTDRFGVPIPGATVTATYATDQSLLGQAAFYYDLTGAQAANPLASVLTYLGKTVATYKLTDSAGSVRIPYLTDRITVGSQPNGVFLGDYDVTATMGAVSSTAMLTFLAYPAMASGDEEASVTVAIQNYVASGSGVPEYIVAPPDLEISDATLTLAVSIVAQDTGDITILDSDLTIVQDYADQRSIALWGEGTLRLERSNLTSTAALTIHVRGNSHLWLVDASLSSAVLIMVHDAGMVHVIRSAVAGPLITDSAAAAWVWAEDSSFSVAPVLDGTSVGYFVNVAAAAGLTAQGSAVVGVYQWITILVLDGASSPLRNTVVSAYFLNANNTLHRTLTTDATGTVKLLALSDRIVASGTTYYGTYRVTAVYTFDGDVNQTEVLVSLVPYSVPLAPGAVSFTLTLPEVMPDLDLPVMVSNGSPVRGEIVQVTARVYNNGSSDAFNVVVRFYDDLDGILTGAEVYAEVVVPLIPAVPGGAYVNVTVNYTATFPVQATHHLTVVADPDNLIPELNEDNNVGSVDIFVGGRADFYVSEAGISLSPSLLVQGSVATVTALVYNYGDFPGQDVSVQLRVDGIVVDSQILANVPASTSAVAASFSWPLTVVGSHELRVEVDPADVIPELPVYPNVAYKNVTVLARPNLIVNSITFSSVSGGGSAVDAGDVLTITVQVSNGGGAPVDSFGLKITIQNETLPIFDGTVALQLLPGATTNRTATWTAKASQPTDVRKVYAEVDPLNLISETSEEDNVRNRTLTIYDPRADLVVHPTDVQLYKVGEAVGRLTTITQGDLLTLKVNVNNTGRRNAVTALLGPATFQVEIIQVGTGTVMKAFTATGIVNATDSLTIPFGTFVARHIWPAGSYQLKVTADALNQVDESGDGAPTDNNVAIMPLTVALAPVTLTVSSPEDNNAFGPGDEVAITLVVTDAASDVGVEGVGLEVTLLDSTGALLTTSRHPAALSDSEGILIDSFVIPDQLEADSYTLRLNLTLTDRSTYDDVPITIGKAGAAGFLGLDWWLWIVIAAVAAGGIGGASLYLYKYGLGKLVECGECGAFIPETAMKCPNCGVEFERETMKCSECGAWIPATSTECPQCGAKFAAEGVEAPPVSEEEAYQAEMRRQYDAMLDNYRELAKRQLGRRYTEAAFEAWWAAHPNYITFEDWLAKEEEKKREGAFPCPECGTLNPRDATVCHKCGTVFGVERAMEEAGPPGAPPPGAEAPRTVIRRPIDRKVVPKKIIRKPLEEGGEGGGGEGTA